MKFIWEAGDIVNGLRIVQPAKGTTATIGWFGYSGARRIVLMETNTDGMVHGQHKTKQNGELFHDMKGELVFEPFTEQEMANYLNEATYPWLPAAIFTGTGQRMKTDGNGRYRPETIGLKKLGVIRG